MPPEKTPAKRIHIIVDSREQLPVQFCSKTDIDTFIISVEKLDTGDYSIAGKTNLVCVERKSTDDFVSSLTHGRKRFFNEIERMQNIPIRCIVVECGWIDIVSHNYRSEATPNSIIGSAMSIIVDRDVPIFFVGNRVNAERFIKGFLIRAYNRTIRDISMWQEFC